MKNLLALATYFLVYSFFGWIIDVTSRTVENRRITIGNFLFTPLSPIFGIPMISIVIFSNSLKELNIILFFLLASVILTAWEFIVGYLLELIFHKKYWNYNNAKLNYKGKICLQTSISWGVLAILFIYLIHPFIAPKIELIPENILIVILTISYSILSIDIIASTTRYIIKRPKNINS